MTDKTKKIIWLLTFPIWMLPAFVLLIGAWFLDGIISAFSDLFEDESK